MNGYTLRQFLTTPGQHFRLLDQCWRNTIHCDTLCSIRVGKPVHKAVERRLCRPVNRRQLLSHHVFCLGIPLTRNVVQ
jgi:hypothetical protein